MGISYRLEIDGLRAVAVAAVVLYHAGLGGAGYVGVDIFFVISGYLITALLLRERDQSGRIDLLGFYARRVRRIFPAVTVVMIAVLGASALLLHPVEQTAVTESAIAATLFLANVHFQFNTGGYFQEAAEHLPLLHLWSLSVEEQFYLVWPALVIFTPRRALVPVLVGLGISSFGLAEWFGPHAAFYQMPSRFWELAAGGLVASLPARQLPRWVPWLALVIILDACLVPIEHFPGVGALPAVLGAGLLIATIHGGATNALLASRPMVGLGVISYSLYLWHWPLLALYRAGGGFSGQMRMLLCGLAVVLAIASYRYVEQPFRRSGATKADSYRAVVVGFCAFAVLALTAYSLKLKELRTDQVMASRDYPATECHNTMPASKCASAPGPVTVAMWGDSMAYAWQPLAVELARRQNTAALSFSRNACKPAIGYINPLREECEPWARESLERVKRMDTVIMASRWNYEFFELDRAKAEAGLRSAMNELKDVRRVIVIGPSPSLRDNAFKCMDGNDLEQCAVREVDFLQASAADRATLKALVAAHPNAEYLEAADWLCRDGSCPATREGMVLYYDRFHVSSTAARAFAKRFDAKELSD